MPSDPFRLTLNEVWSSCQSPGALGGTGCNEWSAVTVHRSLSNLAVCGLISGPAFGDWPTHSESQSIQAAGAAVQLCSMVMVPGCQPAPPRLSQRSQRERQCYLLVMCLSLLSNNSTLRWSQKPPGGQAERRSSLAQPTQMNHTESVACTKRLSGAVANGRPQRFLQRYGNISCRLH